MEARDPDGESTAKHLQTTFAGRFLDLRYTVHPGDIPGESPGKSSNVSWAAKDVERRYQNNLAWRDVLVTVMDSKSNIFWRTLHRLTWYYRRHTPSLAVFHRNTDKTPEKLPER